MAIAFDAVSSDFSDNDSTTSHSWTHTPSGTPGFILVGLAYAIQSTDIVSGVTYGGEAMTEVTGSPLLQASGEAHGLYLYCLGLSGDTVPTGAQTVEVTTAASFSDRAGMCVSYTTGAVCEVIDTDTQQSTSTTDPGGSLALGGSTCAAALVGFSGIALGTNISPLSGWTSRAEVSTGSAHGLLYTYDTVGSSDVTTGFTNSSADDAALISIAFAEVASAGSILPLLNAYYS